MRANSDVDEILRAIRVEVRKMKARGDQAPAPPKPHPIFQIKRRRGSGPRRVRAGDLLRLRDEAFIRRAYLELLNRQPDAEGLRHWLRILREDGVGRALVLRMISRSPEGRIHAIPIRGLGPRAAAQAFAAALRDGWKRRPRRGSRKSKPRA